MVVLIIEIEQAWCGIYGMAPTIQAQHVVAVTIPTIAVIFFTYLWYKKRSNSVTRGRSDPGGGGGTSKKRNRHRTSAGSSHSNSATTSPASAVAISAIAEKETSPVSSSSSLVSEEMKTAMQKAIRDLETAAPIQEVCSDTEEAFAEQETTTVASQTVLAGAKACSETSHIEGETDTVTESVQREGDNDDSSDVAVSAPEHLSWSAMLSESDVEEVPIQKHTKCDLGSTGSSSNSNNPTIIQQTDNAAESTQVNGGTSSEEGVEVATATSDDKGCEWKVRSATTMTSVATQSGGQLCCGVQRPSKNGVSGGASDKSRNNHKDKAAAVNDDLDVAMQKLESMRISGGGGSADKTTPKRKSTTTSTKRQSLNAKDATSASSADEKTNAGSRAGAKSPAPTSLTTATANATSPPHSSKAKKRKSRKKAKLTNGNNSDENTTCKALTDEGSDGDARNTCDSIKNYDVCADRTAAADKNNAKCAYSSSRARVPENERIYINSHDDDSLRCSIKKTDDCDRKVVENHQQEDCDNERDSANHSPVDNILDSQSVHFSDAHSEGSSDSGKGCSEGAMSPSPQTPAGGSSISGDQNMVLLFQFVIPQEHVGKLIGRHGQFINTIKSDSNTRIYIKKHPTSFKKKICALEGTQQEINKALELIRNRFPEETYPDVTLEEFPMSLPIACPLRPELFQLDLVEGVNNDVVISSVVTAGHLFLQQPMHPSYQSLTLLNISMNQVYSSPEAPVVSKPAKDNIVAAPAMDGWYRAQIVSVSESTDSCEVRFLDYGGYLTLNTSCLRAVRADFLTLPFQAVECILANVSPINGTWCEDAKLVVQGLTYGQILQAQVYDYSPEGIPYILLYAVHGTQVILINQELVARGFAFPTLPNEGGAQSDEYYVYP
ncbi:A-kinase anchor protein 1, mitochondrial isoform X2 [Planococcus citri]|uniref:A-kinase anchor protein 1, mitochondrial isoform X2 n=1 Tax=Planococcus citri TaxID=170843 RepID=UPI0031F83CF7